MIADILLKKGSGVPSSLKLAEPAVDLLNKILYIGLTENENGDSDFMKIIDENKILQLISENIQEAGYKEYIEEQIEQVRSEIPSIEGLASEEYVDDATRNVINIVNNLHYYGDKDIIVNKDLFNIESEILSIDCSEITNGGLVIPYDLENYSTINVVSPENVDRIVIPRGVELINNTAMSDEDLLNMFINLNIIVRVNEDGTVWSYNIEEQSIN